MESIAAVRGIELTSMRFKRQLVQLAERIGAQPDSLAAVMSFETRGTFAPDVRNPTSKAVGLIQFTKPAALGLGTTRDKLARMTAVQQLPFVERFFDLAGVVGRMKTPTDTYLGVFAPAFVGRGPDVPIYTAPSKSYEQNKKLDREKKGFITTTDAARPVLNILGAAKTRPRVPIEPKTPGIGPGPFVLFGLLVWGIYKIKRNGNAAANS